MEIFKVTISADESGGVVVNGLFNEDKIFNHFMNEQADKFPKSSRELNNGNYVYTIDDDDIVRLYEALKDGYKLMLEYLIADISIYIYGTPWGYSDTLN